MGRRSGEIDPLDVRQAEPGAAPDRAPRASAMADGTVDDPYANYRKADTTVEGDDADLVAARLQIEQTRVEMGETIDAIQERLQPDVLTQQAKDAARHAAQEKMDEVKGNIKQATVGKVSDAMGAASDTVQSMMGSASDAISGAGQRVQETVGAGMGTTNEAMQSARTAVAGNGLVDTIRRHPVPIALAAIGLGWLFVSMRNDDSMPSDAPTTMPRTRYAGAGSYGYGPGKATDVAPVDTAAYQTQGSGGSGMTNAAGQMAGKARDTLGQVSGRARDNMSQMGNQAMNSMSQAGDTMGQMGSQARDNLAQMGGQATAKAQQMQSGFMSLVRSNPLAVGVAVAGLGMLVGLAVPETEKENELLGEARDSLMDKASQTVRDTAQNAVQSAVQETLGRS